MPTTDKTAVFKIKKIILSILISLLSFTSFSQYSSVYIEGKFNENITGDISIQTYHNDTTMIFVSNTTPIVNNVFKLNGKLLYPQSTRLFLSNNSNEYFSDLFFISADSIFISINIVGDKLIIQSDNAIFNEYKDGFKKILDQFDQAESALQKRNSDTGPENKEAKEKELEKELSKIKLQALKILKDYVCANPKSYIGLDKILSAMDAYNILLSDAYDCLDKALKETFHGNKILKSLDCSKQLTLGNRFPDFELVDTLGIKTNISELKLKKYNLIEFWHSGCGSCKVLFPTLQSLHDKYAEKNLAILSISGDLTRNEDIWKKLITKHQLSWPQYWDIDHKQTSECLIKWYPTNFLLDSQGKILAKNIKLNELEEMLK